MKTLAKQPQLPKASWQLMDPKTAQKILDERSAGNRRLVPHHINFLATEITEGRWQINGDTIRFSDKRLLDGQHRLHAIIQADIAVWLLVVEELPEPAFDTIDTGRVRGAGDLVSIMFGANPNGLAAAAKFIWYQDHGELLQSARKLSNHQVLETIRGEPLLLEMAEFSNVHPIIRTSPSITALVLIARRAGKHAALEFGRALSTGANLNEHSPIRFLREKWLSEKKRRYDRIGRVIWIAIIIKTFNLYLRNQAVNRCPAWRTEEKFPEACPLLNETEK